MKDKKHILSICSKGCIVTRETGNHVVPHHVKGFSAGWGQVSDYFAIPLVSRLHTIQEDSVHANRSLFEDRYGRELDLLAKTLQREFKTYRKERLPF